ncbi:MAG: ABC transporter substrate-binding protein [Firmicutes bacterium]|nr:ABC transporter substrate-binding protein [Candidatus Colimorpha enterica]
MKKFVKFVSAAMAVALAVVCFASCSSNQVFKKDTWNIGCTGPLTGDAASYGISVQKGATIAIEEINAAGGLNGYLFAFDMKDDKAEAADAATGYDTLFEAGMQVSLGSVTSGSCKSFAAKAAQDNVFFITPSASEEAVIQYGDNAFRVCFGDPDQGTLAADQIKADGYTNVGVIYETSSSYSAGVFDAFKAEAEKIGLEYKLATFDGENNKDFSSQVETLKDCDIFFMPFYYTEASLVAKAATAKGVNAVLFGVDGFDGIDAMFTKDDVINNKILYITPFDAESTDPTVSKFVAAYKAKYNETPDQFAADGYDSVMAIYNAMKKADVKDVNISASDLCNLLKAAITASDFSYTGATGTMTWATSGACTKVPQIKEMKR